MIYARTAAEVQNKIRGRSTACMVFWALLASGQIVLRKVDGWQTLHEPPRELELDRTA